MQEVPVREKLEPIDARDPLVTIQAVFSATGEPTAVQDMPGVSTGVIAVLDPKPQPLMGGIGGAVVGDEGIQIDVFLVVSRAPVSIIDPAKPMVFSLMVPVRASFTSGLRRMEDLREGQKRSITAMASGRTELSVSLRVYHLAPIAGVMSNFVGAFRVKVCLPTLKARI